MSETKKNTIFHKTDVFFFKIKKMPFFCNRPKNGI